MKYLPPNRRGTRLGAALALTAAASLMFAACGGGGNTGTPGGEASASGGGGGGGKAAVTLITKDNNNPFLISMQKGAKDAAAKNGVTLTKAAGAKDGDEDGQVKAIEAAVARGDKGISDRAERARGQRRHRQRQEPRDLYVIALIHRRTRPTLSTSPSPPTTSRPVS